MTEILSRFLFLTFYSTTFGKKRQEEWKNNFMNKEYAFLLTK